MDWQWACSAWSLRFVKNQGSSRNCVRAGDAERCVGMAGLRLAVTIGSSVDRRRPGTVRGETVNTVCSSVRFPRV
jgi:hypothetical protein